jgi:hypothetical protein
MLVIRDEQMRILARHSSVSSLLHHLRDVAPDGCAEMSPEQMRSIADYCLERCEHHGIKREYDILRYLNLMLVFGFNFDTEQAWAAAPLALANPSGRMELLMDYALMESARSTPQAREY